MALCCISSRRDGLHSPSLSLVSRALHCHLSMSIIALDGGFLSCNHNSSRPSKACNIVVSSHRLKICLLQNGVSPPSNTAKHGTWQGIRLRDTPLTTRPNFSGTVSQDTSRTSTALQTIPGSHRAYCFRVNISEAMQNFQSLNTTQASERFKVHRLVRIAVRLWLDRQISNGSSAHVRLGTIEAANDLLLRRALLLDHSVYTSAQMSFSMQKSWSDNVSCLSHWKSVSGCRVSKSTTISMKDLDAAVGILHLVLSNVQASRTTQHEIARLLVRLWAKGSAIAISLHESEQGICVRLQPIETQKIETSPSPLQHASTGGTFKWIGFAMISLLEVSASISDSSGDII